MGREIGYLISYAAILEFYNNIKNFRADLNAGFQINNNAFNKAKDQDIIKGTAADHINCFLDQVYNKCFEAINRALEEIEYRVAFYALGWYEIDAQPGAILNTVTIDSYREYADKNVRNDMGNVLHEINTALFEISDIIPGGGVSIDDYIGNVEIINSGLNSYLSKIDSYEERSSDEFNNVFVLLECAKKVISQYASINVRGYKSGDINNNLDYIAMNEALNISSMYVEANKGRYIETSETLNALAKEYYSKNSMIKDFYLYASDFGVGKAFTHFFSEDPVDLSTGNFVYQKKDVIVEGDVSLEFTRFYNALISGRASTIGNGFVHNYDMSLKASEDKRLIEVIMPDGHKIFFALNEQDEYENVFSDYEKLAIVDETYVLSINDNYRYIFNSTGLIIREEDSNHIGIDYTYSDNHLEKVSTMDGGYISFDYNQNGLIESISTSNGRIVRYEYKDNYLLDVFMPNSNRYHYVYSSDGQIEEVLNGDEVSIVKNVYDDYGRVTRQDFIDGSNMTYEYSDNSVKLTERNGAVTSYIHDELNRTTKVVYPDKSTEEFRYNDKNLKVRSRDRNGFETRYEYTNSGELFKVVNPLGVSTALTYDKNGNVTSVVEDGVVIESAEYDENSNLIKSVNGEKGERTFGYDEKGHVIRIIDEDKNATNIEYDERGNVVLVTKPSGATVSYEYDKYNRPVKTIDGNGNVTSFEYDINDRITKVINPLDEEATFKYNLMGKVVSLTDYDNNTIGVTYNDLNKETSIIDKEGNTIHFEYDKMWNRSKTIFPSGAVIKNVYDKNNRLSKVILPEGQTQSVTYDANGNIISETDGVGSVTRYKYDALNRIIGITNALGRETKYKYDRNNNIIKVIDVDGNETSYEYDKNNRRISITNKLGEKTYFEYYPSGKRKKIIYADKTYEEFTYDKGLLIKVRNRNGVITSLEYDNNENIISEVNAAGDIIKYEYNALNRLIAITLPTGGVRCFEYDSAGNMTAVIDENSNKTIYEYTPNGKLNRVIDANNNETVYSYDSVGNLVEVRRIGDFEEITNYEYDLNGNVVRVTDPLGNSDVYTYDGAGRVISKFDRDENLTKITYNKIGQVELIKYSDSTEVKMSYNSLGFLQEIIDINGKTNIETDILGRTISSTDYLGNKVQYEYGIDKRTSLVYPDGKRLDYNYNDNGLLESILLDKENLVSYKYDDMARVLSKSLSNGQVSDFTYNNVGRLASVVHDINGKIESLKFEYDLTGNKISVVKNRDSDSGIYEYSYDALNQLTSVSKGKNVLREYTYDSFGNRLSKKSYVDDVTYKYSYNSNNQLIEEIVDGKSSTNKKYSYDKRGNLTHVIVDGILSNEYIYNANNQLSRASLINEYGKTSASYTYNGMGQRVCQLVNTPTDPAQKINYVLDITKRYNNMLTESEGEVVTNYYYDNVAIALDKEDEMSYYVQDDLGSILGLTDKDCSFVEKHDYDEFGNELVEVVNPVQSLSYTGYRKELTTSSLYAQARQYNPLHGRFMSEDIVKGDRMMPISLNSYVYCYNKPEDYVDVDGREAVYALNLMDDLSPRGKELVNGIYNTTLGEIKQEVFNQVGEQIINNKMGMPNFDFVKKPVKGTSTKIKYVKISDSSVYQGGRGGARYMKLDSLKNGASEVSIKYQGAEAMLKKLGGALVVAFSLKDAYDEYMTSEGSEDERLINAMTEGMFSAAGGALSMVISGAVTGALLGSVAPGIGTLIGFAIGLVVSLAWYLVFDFIEIDGKSLKDWTKEGLKEVWHNYEDWSQQVTKCFGEEPS
ncbi:MAG: hypothetical protein E7279_07110 [Lachnospiraceae bacterium]|nr:hypothetical protein [Lachnospiraceae bacterium]